VEKGFESYGQPNAAKLKKNKNESWWPHDSQPAKAKANLVHRRGCAIEISKTGL